MPDIFTYLAELLQNIERKYQDEKELKCEVPYTKQIIKKNKLKDD